MCGQTQKVYAKNVVCACDFIYLIWSSVLEKKLLPTLCLSSCNAFFTHCRWTGDMEYVHFIKTCWFIRCLRSENLCIETATTACLFPHYNITQRILGFEIRYLAHILPSFFSLFNVLAACANVWVWRFFLREFYDLAIEILLKWFRLRAVFQVWFQWRVCIRTFDRKFISVELFLIFSAKI